MEKQTILIAGFLIVCVCGLFFIFFSGAAPSSSEPDTFWINIIGRGEIQSGTATPFIIQYGNNGSKEIPIPKISIRLTPPRSSVRIRSPGEPWQTMDKAYLLDLSLYQNGTGVLEPNSRFSLVIFIEADLPQKVVLTFQEVRNTSSPSYVKSMKGKDTIYSSVDFTTGDVTDPLVFVRSSPLTFSSLKGPFGRSWDYIYNQDFPLAKNNTRIRHLVSTDGQEVMVFLYDNNSRLGGILDRNGNSLHIKYNQQGEIESIEAKDGTKTTYQYDRDHLLTSQTLSDGSQIRYSYETRGDTVALRKVEYPDGSYEEYKYNGEGQLTERNTKQNGELISQKYDYQSNSVTTNDPIITHRYTYNEAGQVLSAQIGDLTSTYSYDTQNRIVKSTDAAGNSFTITYDDGRNQKRMTDPLGNTITYTYDPATNRTTSITDPNQNRSDFLVDANTQTVTTRYPDGTTEEAGPGGQGIIHIKNRDGSGITYQYDDVGRLKKTVSSGGRTIEYTYNPEGSITRISDGNDWIGYQYGPDNQLSEVQYSNGAHIVYGYSDEGLLKSLSQDNGYRASYEYSPQKRLTVIKDENNVSLASYEYDGSGRTVKRTLGNGIVTTYEYNPQNFFSKIVHRSATGAVLSSFEYEYNKVGLPTTIRTNEGTYHYEYDAIGQLTGFKFQDEKEIKYQYDGCGNRIIEVIRGQTLPYRSNMLNQYTSRGAQEFSYDRSGNLISAVTGNITTLYNYKGGVLASLETQDGRFEYSSDPVSNRKEISVNGEKTTYTVDPSGLGSVLGISKNDGKELYSYYFGPDLVATKNGNGEPFYYLTDANANVWQLTDKAGNVVNSYRYEPFGTITRVKEMVYNPFTYTGGAGVLDDNNGLYSMRNRFYSPVLGRFISPDPLGYSSGDFNLYRYAGNNPVNQNDPSGLDTDWTPSGGRSSYQTIGISAPSSVVPLKSDVVNPQVSQYENTVNTGFQATGRIFQYTPGKTVVPPSAEETQKYWSTFAVNEGFRLASLIAPKGITLPSIQVEAEGYPQAFSILPNPELRIPMREKDTTLSISPPLTESGIKLAVYTTANVLGRNIPQVDVAEDIFSISEMGLDTTMAVVNYGRKFETYSNSPSYGLNSNLYGSSHDILMPTYDANNDPSNWQKPIDAINFNSNPTSSLISSSQSSMSNQVMQIYPMQEQQIPISYDWQKTVRPPDPPDFLGGAGVGPSSPMPIIGPNIDYYGAINGNDRIINEINQRSIDQISQPYSSYSSPYSYGPNSLLGTYSSDPMISDVLDIDLSPMGDSDLSRTLNMIDAGNSIYTHPSYYDSIYGDGLGGINFANINLNYISLKQEGGVQRFSYLMKASPGSKTGSPIDPAHATPLAANTFFVGLTMPNEDFWVNLNPSEPDRIIDPALAKTDSGRIMLEADLQMKRDYAWYRSSCDSPVMSQYNDKLYTYEKEKIADVLSHYPQYSIDPKNIHYQKVIRHWILPDKVNVFEDSNEAYLLNQSLTISRGELQEDLISNLQYTGSGTLSADIKQDLEEAGIDILKQDFKLEDLMIKPLMVKKVNEDPAYADLRTVYSSLALAQWYKKKFNYQDAIFSDKINTGDLRGLESSISWSPLSTYNEYIQSYTEGETSCTLNKGTHSITYSSGGVDFSKIPMDSAGKVPLTVSIPINQALYQNQQVSQGNKNIPVLPSMPMIDGSYVVGDSILYFKTVPELLELDPIISPTNTVSSKKEAFNYSFIIVGIIAGILIIGGYFRLRKKEDF